MAAELVVDTSVVIPAVLAGTFSPVVNFQLIAPPLLWSEVVSVLHEATWRGEIARPDAESAREQLRVAPIARRETRRLHDRAWELADSLGLAKTYDAEFLALADLRGCRLVTADARLRRAADRLGLVVGPTELR